MLALTSCSSAIRRPIHDPIRVPPTLTPAAGTPTRHRRASYDIPL
jgi:hypothetical protein